jgi:hypothetical protein
LSRPPNAISAPFWRRFESGLIDWNHKISISLARKTSSPLSAPRACNNLKVKLAEITEP